MGPHATTLTARKKTLIHQRPKIGMKALFKLKRLDMIMMNR